MRFPMLSIPVAVASLIAVHACSSGDAGMPTTDSATGGRGSASRGGSSSGGSDHGATSSNVQGGSTGSQDSDSSVPSEGGASSAEQGGTSSALGSNAERGGASTTAQGGGSALGGSTAKVGSSASGGSVASCTAPPTPVQSWKSFAACKATTKEMDTAYASWKSSYYVECSGGQAYVKAVAGTDKSPAVVSEGIAYGMLITANLNKSDEFGKLWAFYKARRNSNGLMPWKYPVACTGDPVKGDKNAASDADIDAAIALLVAAKNFSNSSYLSDAKALIAAVKKTETASCSSNRTLIKASDGWGGCDDLNPSYFAPGYYRVFGKVTSDSAFWDKMASDAHSMLAVWQAKMKGQVPDWGKDDGSLGSKTNPSSSTYGAEACRAPWRIAVDYGWSQHADAKKFLTNMYEGILEKAKPYIATTTEQHTSAFVGGYSMVGSAIDQPTADIYFNDFYFAHGVLEWDDNYYPVTLKLLYLITAGGRFDNGQ